jgi:PAS domain S-box-containing protein
MGALALPSSTPETVPPLRPFLRSWNHKPASQLAACGNHDHLALIYDNQEEQLDIIVPFLRMGLERGEKSIYIVDDSTPDAVLNAMERHGIDVAAATLSGALAIITKHDAYLKNGDFDPDWMIAFLVKAVEDAKREGFQAVRASGEMTWALGPSGDAHNRLIDYECRLNKFFPQHNMSGICQYNRRRFRPETLMHVIHTHPRIVFRHEVCENPYYIPPEVYGGEGAGMEDAVRRLLEGMVENNRLRRQLTAETEALRHSERRYRELLQALPVAVYTTDADGRINLFNEAAAALSGREPRAGEDSWNLAQRLYRADGSVLPHSESPMAVALRSGEEQRGLEVIGEKPDGTTVWFTPHPTLVRDATGRITGGINVLVDITQRKRAESLLLEQKQALEMIAAGRPLDECLTALTAAVTRLSPRARAAVLVADPSGARLERAVSGTFPLSFSEAIETAPLGACGLAIGDSASVTSADIAGDERWSKPWRELCLAHGIRACHTAPAFAGDGRRVAAVLLGFAELRPPDEFELAIAEFCARVAGIAIDRATADERQRALDAALRRAEQLGAAGRMAAAIAHEINNPLESIVNLWYLLSVQNLPLRAREYVQTMGGELNRVSHIAKQTLEFYRMGKTPETVNVGEQIADAVRLCLRRAHAQGADISIENRAEAALYGFAGELRQLFMNLVFNALEAGAGRIRIRTSRGCGWNQSWRSGVRIMVADDGEGIPASTAARIFEPFFTTKAEKGTGLGLWVSKGIVQKHEGSIRMRTSTRPEQSGTVFSIFLPTTAL